MTNSPGVSDHGQILPFEMNKEISFWKFISDRLHDNQPVMLLVVADSEGSSPGRPGFKMAIGKDGLLQGSIGGGIMEVKLVELGKKLLQDASTHPILKKQIHSKKVSLNQSGMICSGEQTVLYFVLTPDLLEKVNTCIDLIQHGRPGQLLLEHIDGEASFDVIQDHTVDPNYFFEKKNETEFLYRENLGYTHHLYILGGGHCALALSELMARLKFYIHVWDDRPHLNTMEQNSFAQEKRIVETYDRMGDTIPSGENIYVVVMTLGYRTDLQVLLSLKEKKFGYLGVLGSEAKINMIREELLKNNFPASLLSTMHAPIGIKINSHTPEEIAVSIAAEIIGHRNMSPV
jgi:xanthine dehydrogenase accessory factor